MTARLKKKKNLVLDSSFNILTFDKLKKEFLRIVTFKTY